MALGWRWASSLRQIEQQLPEGRCASHLSRPPLTWTLRLGRTVIWQRMNVRSNTEVEARALLASLFTNGAAEWTTLSAINVGVYPAMGVLSKRNGFKNGLIELY
jgi:hypothetical protein